MKTSVIIDNNPHPELPLHTEHGLCMFFEADGFKWLMDIGGSPKFYENAEQLHIAIEDIDFVILSHAHCDHTGGLAKFLEVNSKAKIFVSKHIFGKQFFSYRTDSKQNISVDFSIIEQYIHRFTFVDSNMELSSNVHLICKFQQIYATPKGNKKLYVIDEQGERNDDFAHEIVLSVTTPKGIVVYSGCSHNGVLNILESCATFHKNDTIIACIGGTHLLDSGASSHNETDSDILEIGNTIISKYPKIQIITGHCTGVLAQKNLDVILKENVSLFYSGYSTDL